MRQAGHVVCIGKSRGVWKFWWGKSEGKGALERPRRRWEDNIEMALQEMG